MFKTKVSILALVLITFVLFVQGLKFDFTNWDDPQYILKNEWIRNFDDTLIKKAFLETHFGHYHPFTWLSLSFDYMFFKLKPWGYHLHNLLLHILNVVLAFVFLQQLTKNNRLSFFVALAFAIHPFANESVMWITERKNLLFSLFYLLSLISFVLYIEKNKTKYYWISFLCFVASLLSKGAAFTLPVALGLILYASKNLSLKNSLKLIPFIVLSIFFAIIAMKAQSPFLKENNVSLTFLDSFMFSSWAGWIYVIKAIVPYNLSALHPIILDYIKPYYFIGVFLLLFLIYLIYSSIKNNEKIIVFGLLFFFLNIVMYLKIFDAYASSYFMAERYTYLSYIGLYLALFGKFIDRYWNKSLMKFVIIIWFIFIAFSSFIYGKTWKNSISLWENTLKHYPESHIALLNYGNACRDAKQYNKALESYEKISKNSSLYFKMLENRAFVYYNLKQYQDALNDYQKLLNHFPERQDIEQYVISILIESGQSHIAKETALKLLSKNPQMSQAWNSLGNYYLETKQTDSAIYAYSKAIELTPTAMYYYNRANVYSQLNILDLALNDYNKAIKLDSNNSKYFINRGITFYKQNKYIDALNDFNRAISLEPKNTDYYLNRSTLYVSTKQYLLALLDLNKIIELEPKNGEAFIRRSYLYYQMYEIKLACRDAQKAIDLGYIQYNDWKKKVCK